MESRGNHLADVAARYRRLLPAAVLALGAEAAADPFISEYVEGSTNNKAIELYSAAVYDLAANSCQLLSYHNGSTLPTTTVDLNGAIAAGGVYVVGHVSADAGISGVADQLTSVGWFNGNDAVALSCNETALDVIGQIGFDPGSEWGSGDTSTQNNTLRRLSNVTGGDPDASNVFDPADEWAGYGQDTFDGLGEHTVDSSGGSAAVIINEIDADTAGIESAEFIELFDGGAGGTNLSGLVIVLYNGVSDASYSAFDLDGQTTDANGYFVLCSDASSVVTCDLDVTPETYLIQNGADAVALYAGSATDFPTGTAVTSTALKDAVVYGTSDPDNLALIGGATRRWPASS